MERRRAIQASGCRRDSYLTEGAREGGQVEHPLDVRLVRLEHGGAGEGIEVVVESQGCRATPKILRARPAAQSARRHSGWTASRGLEPPASYEACGFSEESVVVMTALELRARGRREREGEPSSSAASFEPARGQRQT